METREGMEESGRERKCEGWLEKERCNFLCGVLVLIRLLLG